MLSTFSRPSPAPLQAQPGQPPNVYPQLPSQAAQAWGPGYPTYSFGGPSIPPGQTHLQPYGEPHNPYSQGPSQLVPGQQSAPGQLVLAPSQTVQQFNPFTSQSQAVSQPSPAAQTGPVVQPPAAAAWRSAYVPSGPTTQLAPQQLESVAKDEDPVYGPLGRARGKVERALIADNEISPDLADELQMPTNEPYVPLPGGVAFRPLRVVRTTPLPDALHQELNYKHLTAKMGLFEEIERAWFTLDNKLFLWDYSDGRDFSRFDEQADIIQAVGLVKARKDVFVDDITHLLVICTSTKISLLGLSRPSPREINLYATNLSVDAPCAMLIVSSTVSGRIFLLGANKDLYELEYSSDSSWFFGSSTKVQLHNRSSSSLSNWVPTVFSSSNREGIESFAIDPQQGRLFTLHTRGEIEYYDVSTSNFVSRGKYTRLKSDLVSRGYAGQAPGYVGARVVSIAAVEGHESRRACMVAITANGVRVYFTTTPFTPLAFRPPPTGDLNLSSETFYSSGTVLGIQHNTSTPTRTTSLTAIVPHPGLQAAGRENFENFLPPSLQEWSLTDTIPSQVWTIAEVPSTNPINSGVGLRRNDGLALSPLPRQASESARQFLVLATSGLFFVAQPRPIDVLQADVELEKDAAINTVRNTFGKTQLAAMAIQLGSTSDIKQPDIASAVSTILLSAGAPALRDGNAGKTIVYSPRHDGLAALIARLLRAIWSSKVTAPALGGRQVLGVREGVLLAVQSRLESLRKYIDEHPFPRHQTEGDAKIAWDQEELSLHGLSVLLKQAIEAISFVLLLSDYKLGDVVAKCEPSLQATLANLTYQGLLTSLDGREVARKLVTALIEQQIGQELGIDTLSEILQQRCGTFCQPGDVVLYKAEESMRRAESTRDPIEREDYLRESLRSASFYLLVLTRSLFSKASSSVPIPRLQDVSERYRSMQYTLGAIELPLRCAVELDPQDKARDYVRDGEHPSDPRKALYTARMECYACVIEALAMLDELLDRATESSSNIDATVKKRDDAYALAIASDDELFHFYLYDWHVSRHLQEQLLEFDTPYIERYLRITSNSVEERRDLLWKYYARREEYLLAAKALFDLATRQSPMTLNDRVYYLAQSLTSAKSAANIGAEDVDFTSNLQERMDVASVQMEVAKGIEVHVELTAEEKGAAMGKLNEELMGLDELYQNFARPYRLYEPILLILKTADTRIDDVLEAVWRQLLAQAAQRGGQLPAESMGETVTELCRRFFPSEAAPLDIVLPVVYSEASAVGGEPGWASSALLDGGLPLRDVWEGAVSLHEETEEKEFYAEEAALLALRWLQAREAIPAADVERFASAYLLRTNAGTDARRNGTREKFSAAKAAAGRY